MLLDRFVSFFTACTCFDCFHQDGSGREEGAVALVFLTNHGGIDFHLIQNREEGVDQPVDGEKTIWQEDTAHDGARDVPLIPLIARQLARHGKVAL